MKTIYLVPHTHYDIVWAFERQDYLDINTSILKTALKMIRDSGYRFLIEQTYPIEQVELSDPEFFAELRAAIQAGTVEVVDGQYVMADPMTPSGEVLVREFLFGNLYAEAKLGVEIPVAWAADGFGLNAQLPQIYRRCGFRWLVFRRGLPRSIGYRVSEFLWEGLDGSKIVAHWLPLGYRAGLDLDKWEQTVAHLGALATTSQILMPCGSGGVPPQEDTPACVEKWNREHTDSQMVIATPRQFFQAFDKESKTLSTYRGELYSADLESIFPDAVSSRIRLKLAIKSAEGKLLMAEKLAGLACLYGHPYPAERMNALWKKQLFLAHHDVSPGTGIDQIYGEAWEYIRDIQREGAALSRESVVRLAGSKEKSDGLDLMVFNTNNWKVNDWVEGEVEFPGGFTGEPAVSDGENEAPAEVIEPERDAQGRLLRCRLGFVATVPAMGFRAYRVVKKTREVAGDIQARDNEITTPLYRLEVDKQTGILRVFSRSGAKLAEGNELVIDEEVGDLYFHKSFLQEPIGAEGGGGVKFAAFKPAEITIEQSPLRTILTYRSEFYCLRWPYYLTEKFGNRLYRHKTMEVTKQVIVYPHTPRIDLCTTLETQQSHVRIRLHFDTAMVAPDYTRQTQFGMVDLPRERTLEDGVKVPSLTLVCAEENGRGLAFFSDGAPINEIRAGWVHYTLLRSVSVLSADGVSGPLIPTPDAMQLGHHAFNYSLFPYDGDWRQASIHRRVAEFSQPLSLLQLERQPAREEFEGLVLEPENLVISCLKKSERDATCLLRFFETTGQPCHTRLSLPPQVRAVRTANLLEKDEGEVPLRKGMVEMDVGPFEIVTLKLFLAS